jgi:hypothetical protein
VAVVRLEICLGGGRGIGRQEVSKFVGLAEFADGENECFVLVLMLRGRSEVLGPSSIALEGNEVSLHLLDVVSSETIVAQQLVVVPEGGLCGPDLYATDLVKVRGFAWCIGTSLVSFVSEAPFWTFSSHLPSCSRFASPTRSGFASRGEAPFSPA